MRRRRPALRRTGAEALALFGDKAAARARARELGVPVLAGTGADPSPGQVLALLREHGAVMVKAVAGGGGRGLRPVTREQDLPEAMRRCASEAAAAFGDGRVFAERLLPGARHFEVQVVGDGRAPWPCSATATAACSGGGRS